MKYIAIIFSCCFGLTIKPQAGKNLVFHFFGVHLTIFTLGQNKRLATRCRSNAINLRKKRLQCFLLYHKPQENYHEQCRNEEHNQQIPEMQLNVSFHFISFRISPFSPELTVWDWLRCKRINCQEKKIDGPSCSDPDSKIPKRQKYEAPTEAEDSKHTEKKSFSASIHWGLLHRITHGKPYTGQLNYY